MKLINPNNEILKFIKETVETSGDFYDLKKSEYSLEMDLESKGKDYSSVVSLLIDCEKKFNINIDDHDAWDIKTPLDLYNAIQKEMSKNENNPTR